MPTTTETLRILEPHPAVFAYYDGRIHGKRLHSSADNWLDDGAYALGVASYAIVDGTEALVYDTHISLEHAKAIRAHLESLGVQHIRVVLSHWHKDHVAGNGAFADCEILSLKLTAERLLQNRQKIEQADPPISPLVMPNATFEDSLHLTIGRRRVELHHFAIHSADGNVVFLPEQGLLLAGDTLEDTVTFISEALEIGTHVRELERMKTFPIAKILPAHGDHARIAAGGYSPTLIHANQSYLQRLRNALAMEEDVDSSLERFVAPEIASGAVLYFVPYEAVHRSNIAAVKDVMPILSRDS
ncbi:MBL fold metallo-hydrolase [Rhizobium deserti]|uniref:MBL fold metallo-hydrolase n=1 Tax=Rhizobium deserti TaxID=2547961 RepID=A0A4R5UHG8_9HYPH|nr:MBL fold metallo-hydrolase [Rhizobium deserti]TDK35411.1 MBL fold metallo-hydrolase [Rhizobium deserti]